MLPYQAPTAVDLLSNSHSDSTIPSESSRSIPVPPAASSVQPTNSKPVPVAPINGRTNPPVSESTPDDSHCEFKTVELGEKSQCVYCPYCRMNVQTDVKQRK
ncbi:hypothetical protein WA538_000847 [Blastocystis sp. DL]